MIKEHGDYLDSRSDLQNDIERFVFDEIREKLGNVELDSSPDLLLDADGKSHIRPDFFSEEERIIGEIHAHIGRLKPAQQDKIAGDVLKMLLYDKVKGCTYKKYVVVCGKEEYDQLQGSSYLAEAIRQYDIQLMYIDIPEEMRKKLQNAMKRQDLTKKD